MSDINKVLAIALESEQEAEAVSNTYEGLAQVLDIDNSLADVKHATDVATGLENLQAVLESIQELDAGDIAMVQIIGDIAGASSGGLSGALFTPAMEAVDDGDSSAKDKAASIAAKIGEMIKLIIEKIKQFVNWVVTRAMASLEGLQKSGARLASLVGQTVDKSKYDALKQLLQSDLKLIASLPEFLSTVGEIALARTVFAELNIDEFGQDKQLDKRIVVMQNAQHQVARFGEKYNHVKFLTGIGYQVLTEKIDDTDVSVASYRLLHNVVSVHREKNVDAAQAGEGAVRIGHDLVSAIEDVYNGFAKFQDASKSDTIPSQIRNISKLVQSVGTRYDALLSEAMNKSVNSNSINAVISRTLSGLRTDLQALTTMSYAIAAEQHVLSARYNELSATLRADGQGLAKPAAVAA